VHIWGYNKKREATGSSPSGAPVWEKYVDMAGIHEGKLRHKMGGMNCGEWSGKKPHKDKGLTMGTVQ